MKASSSITSVVSTLLAVFIFGSIANYINEARNDEVTVHLLSCDDVADQKSSVFDCKREFLHTATATFRADHAHQSVITTQYAGPRPIDHCTVLDRQNWRCDNYRSDNSLETQIMSGGNYEYFDSSKFGTLRIMQISYLRYLIKSL